MQNNTRFQFNKIQSAQFKKRTALNKEVIGLVTDFVTLLYLIPFLIILLLVLNEQLTHYEPIITEWLSIMQPIHIGLVSVLLTLKPSKPPLPYSSSDELLTFLPHKKMTIFTFHWLRKMKRNGLVTVALFGLVTWILPVRMDLSLLTFASIYLFQVLMILPRWFTFLQTGFIGILKRMGMTILATGLVIIYPILPLLAQGLFVIIFIAILIMLNVFLYKRVMTRTDWHFVTDMNDYYQFRTFLVRTIMKDAFPKHSVSKKPFKIMRVPFYKRRPDFIYHRLIYLTLRKEKQWLVKQVIQITIIFGLLMIQGPGFYHLGFFIAVVLFVRAYTIMFKTIFIHEPLTSLPHIEMKWLKVYRIWQHGSLLLMLSIIVLPLIFYESETRFLWMHVAILFGLATFVSEAWLRIEIKKTLTRQKQGGVILASIILVWLFYVINQFGAS